MNKKAIVFLCLIVGLLVSGYFIFFHQMSGDNENGRLVLELSPEDFMRDRYTIYPAFLATIRDDSGRKIISRRAFHVKTANGQYLDEYGLFEINNYAFRIRLIEEQTGWFIFSGTDRFIARVLYVDLAD